MINSLFIEGRLVDDPKIFNTKQGKKVANFTLACNMSSGERKTVHFQQCSAWDRKADVVEKYCHKGDKLIVEGVLVTNTYTGTDGQNRRSTNLTVNQLSLQGGKSNEHNNSVVGGREFVASEFAEFDDVDYGDLPF